MVAPAATVVAPITTTAGSCGYNQILTQWGYCQDCPMGQTASGNVCVGGSVVSGSYVNPIVGNRYAPSSWGSSCPTGFVRDVYGTGCTSLNGGNFWLFAEQNPEEAAAEEAASAEESTSAEEEP